MDWNRSQLMLSWDGRVAEKDTRVEEGWEGGQPAKEKTKPSKKANYIISFF